MPELDPKTLEFGQEIEVSNTKEFIGSQIMPFQGYDAIYFFGKQPGYMVWSEKQEDYMWFMYARLPQPKRPDVKPGVVVGVSGGLTGTFLGWTKNGRPIVAVGDVYSRIKVDGKWWPPEEKQNWGEECDCGSLNCQCKKEE